MGSLPHKKVKLPKHPMNVDNNLIIIVSLKLKMHIEMLYSLPFNFKWGII